MKEKRHINIPIFIPHLGCPNDCVFCNQRTISGHSDYRPDGVKDEIDRALSTIDGDADIQIAFFGGSFTGIDRGEMLYLLKTAHEYIKSGKVKSIRLSTRPDYIDDEILCILREHGVKTIELGIQSVSERVLKASKRSHSKEASVMAMKLVKSYGFELVGQMMIGLPYSDLESEIETAKVICDCGADASRIYPTVVFRKTELCEMAERCEYTPLTLDDALYRSKEVKSVFIEKNVECIRVGLQSSDNLYDEEMVYAGDYHSAFGEMVDGEIYFDVIKKYIEDNLLVKDIKDKNITIYAPSGERSKVVGHKRKNSLRLQNEYFVKNVKVIEKREILRYNIILSV